MRRKAKDSRGVRAEFLSTSEQDTEAFGRELASDLASDEVVYLVGELGAGKTALARGLARGLGALPRQVASPSFALLHEYTDKSGRVVLRHLDLYRLRDHREDLEILGLPGAVSGAPVAVEWPGEAIRIALPPTLEVVIEALKEESRRIRVRC